jgi:8-oxo-dGTP diphosphatase
MKLIRVTCGIIEKEGKVLIVQRSDKMSLPMKWEFPGGKIQDGESEESCLLRELKEELNIEVSIKGRLPHNTHDYGTFDIELIPFIVAYVSGDITLLEHGAMALVPKEELVDFDFAPADLPILRAYLAIRA